MASSNQLEDAPTVIGDMDEKDQTDVVTANLGNNYNIMELIVEILQHDTQAHQNLWIEKIESMEETQLKTILDWLSIKSKNKFDESINIEVLKVLLVNWNGLGIYHCKLKNPTKTLYNALFKYLNKNIDKLKSLVLTKLASKDETEVDECIVIECPMKKLKTFFNYRFNIYEGSVYDLTCKDTVRYNQKYSPKHITNWPHTAVKFSIDGFEMLHENYNHDEFNVVNFDNNPYDPVIEHATNTKLHFLPKEFDTCKKSSSIIQYIHNLQIKIPEKMGDLQSNDKKLELMTFLNELTCDIRLVTKNVGIGVSYFMNFCPFPYVRCMANRKNHPKDSVNKKEIDIRLQQIVYPAVKFCVSKFPMISDAESLTREDFMKSLTYYCTFCESKFETDDFFEFTRHIDNVHGTENQKYFCLRCDKCFPVIFLSASRWKHKCTYKSKFRKESETRRNPRRNIARNSK